MFGLLSFFWPVTILILAAECFPIDLLPLFFK